MISGRGMGWKDINEAGSCRSSGQERFPAGGRTQENDKKYAGMQRTIRRYSKQREKLMQRPPRLEESQCV